MKTTLLLIIVALNYSCKSCYECTRTFTKEIYSKDVLGVFQKIGNHDMGGERFEECDKANITTLEKDNKAEQIIVDEDNYYYLIPKCKCVKQ